MYFERFSKADSGEPSASPSSADELSVEVDGGVIGLVLDELSLRVGCGRRGLAAVRRLAGDSSLSDTSLREGSFS